MIIQKGKYHIHAGSYINIDNGKTREILSLPNETVSMYSNETSTRIYMTYSRMITIYEYSMYLFPPTLSYNIGKSDDI